VKWMSRISAQQGLTLVELMITLAVLALVLAVSVPSFSRLQGSFQLRSSAHRLVTTLNLARTEALEREQSISLCPSKSGENCSGDFSRGWLLFHDRDGDRQFNPATDDSIFRAPGLPEGFSVTNRTGSSAANEAITYRPDGSARRNQTLLLCAPPARGIEPYAIVLNLVGRVRMTRGEGSCPGVPG
jgi:type IV fimbrial biogenesis protein FimT